MKDRTINEELTESNLTIFQKNPNITKMMIFLSFLILFISICIGVFEAFHFNIFNFFYNIYLIIYQNLNLTYKKNPIIFYITIYLIQILVISLILPFYLALNLLFAYIIKNKIKSFLLLFTSSLVGSNFVYIICNFGFNKFFKKRVFEGNKIMKQLKNEVKNNQLKYSFILRFMIMPLGLKDYLLCSFNVNFLYFNLSSFVSYFLFALKNSLLGFSLKNLNDIFSNKKIWKNKSNAERFALIFSLVLILITIIMCIILSFWAKKKYNEFEETILNEEGDYDKLLNKEEDFDEDIDMKKLI